MRHALVLLVLAVACGSPPDDTDTDTDVANTDTGVAADPLDTGAGPAVQPPQVVDCPTDASPVAFDLGTATALYLVEECTDGGAWCWPATYVRREGEVLWADCEGGGDTLRLLVVR